VTALSSDAYFQASGEASPLEAWFSPELFILRQGDIFQVPPKLSPEETNGIQPLQYRLEMLEPVLQGYARRDETKIILLSSQDGPSTPQNVGDLEDNEEDLVEIDESFLASSFSMPSESSRPKSCDQESEQPPLSSDGSLSVGYLSQYLDTPFNISEDHCTFYVRPPDLGKLGILSGDWVGELFCTVISDCMTLSGHCWDKIVKFPTRSGCRR
jgi:peroxin-6